MSELFEFSKIEMSETLPTAAEWADLDVEESAAPISVQISELRSQVDYLTAAVEDMEKILAISDILGDAFRASRYEKPPMNIKELRETYEARLAAYANERATEKKKMQEMRQNGYGGESERAN